MAEWTWAIALEPDGPVPLYQQIERAIGRAIRDGSLAPGDPLPSTRALAAALQVTRNTTVAAYRELRAQGWITADPGGRTRVAALPSPPTPGPRPGPRAGFRVDPLPPARPEPLRRPTELRLGAGEPDLRLIPTEALARAMRRALRRRRGALLGYADPRGVPEYLAAMRGWLGATRGLATDPDRLISTRGAQHGLDLVARALCRPGDRVVVEALGYAPAWRVFDLAGAARIPVPVDDEGLRTDVLERVLADGPVRLVYVTPHHQYPTTVSLSAARRQALRRLAATHGFAIVEDDYDHEFQYDGRPLLPLASADPGGHVVYLGTLSKVLAPGIRLGFVHGPPELIRALVELRRSNDRQGDAILESAVAELVDEGELQRHVRRMRETYRRRRDWLDSELRAHLSDVLSWERPVGGIGLWARVLDVDDELWVDRAARRGVLLRKGRDFSATGERIPGLRLVFSALDEGELTTAIESLALARADGHVRPAGRSGRGPRRPA